MPSNCYFCLFLISILLVLPVRLEIFEFQHENTGEVLTKRKIQNTKRSIYKVAVELDNDDETLADEIARIHGFKNNGKIGSLDGFFEFQHDLNSAGNRERRSLRAKRLVQHPRVKWAEVQVEFERFKRGFEEDTAYWACEKKRKREERSRIERVKEIAIEKRKYSHFFRDPMFHEQWYMCNYGQSNSRPGNDINVINVYKRGITGKGVRVSIVDDGVDHLNDDLKKNYDPKASTNLNNQLKGYKPNDPHPDDSDAYNGHGTKCAGEVAAQADNNICGAGIAPNAKLGGVRMLDTPNGKSSDSLEAHALSFGRDYIDIYSNCWGPKDDGKTFGRPGRLGMKALEYGTKYGRNGKGVIFVWATGNGGGAGDNCNCDGYASSIYTISIGAIDKNGKSTYYDEQCSSTNAVIYTDSPVVTTALHNKCTDSFIGTSAAAPLAAGVFALVLEANPKLTWRDMQHIIVKTAKNTSECDPGWRRNAAGNSFNIKFGFGRIDADAMVTAALNWTNVPGQQNCTLKGFSKNRNIPRGGKVVISEVLSGCAITKLEHVQFIVTLKHHRRGDLRIVMKSPQVTESTLLTNRPDDSDKGLKDWAFMSLHFWGENPTGKWQVVIDDNPHSVLVRKNEIPEVMEDPRDELHHGRTGEDYMRDEIPEVMEDPHDELHHGRTGEDYMRDEMLQEDDVSERDHIPFDLIDEEKSVSGRVVEYSFVFYGTKN